MDPALQFSLFNIKYQLQLIFLQSVCIERMQIHSYRHSSLVNKISSQGMILSLNVDLQCELYFIPAENVDRIRLQ
jgi:hypothetical protein